MPESAATQRPRLVFALIFIAHALGAMSLLSVLSSGAFIAAALGLSPLQMGALASVYSAALAAISLPAGFLTDRIGIARAMSLAALCIAAGLSIAAVATGFGQLAAGLALCGAGYGLINPAAGKAITLWFSPDWRTTLLSLKQTGVPVGAALGSGMALLGPVWGWQISIACAAIVALGAATLFWLCLPAQEKATPRAPQTASGWADLRAVPHLHKAALAAGVTNGMQFALWAHLPDIVQQGSGSGVAALGIAFAALHMGTFMGRIGWGVFADYKLQGNAARALRLLCLLALLGCGALAGMVILPSPSLLVAASFLLGLSLCAAIGLHVAVTAQIASDHMLGSALGYTMLMVNLGGVVVPVVLGYALSLGGISAGAATVTALVVLALWLVRDIP